MGEQEQARTVSPVWSRLMLAVLGVAGLAHLLVINLVLAPKLESRQLVASAPRVSATANPEPTTPVQAAPTKTEVPQPMQPAQPAQPQPVQPAAEPDPLPPPQPAAPPAETPVPEPEASAADSDATENEIGRIRLGFPTRSWEPNAEARESIMKAVQAWNRSPERVLHVVGHTDSRGKAEDNLVLSRRRAERVADALHRLGVPMSHIRIEARGEHAPLVRSAGPQGWAMNRRVEILLR